LAHKDVFSQRPSAHLIPLLNCFVLFPIDSMGTVKLLMLGDSAVGKSSLLLRFCDNKFESNFVLTIGVDFKNKSIVRNGKTVELQIWDTAGQERFRTITPAYYKGAMGVVICYDISDKATFSNVEHWIGQINQQGDPAVRKMLIGNKSDLDSNLRQVTSEEGENLAARYNMKFF